jgi:hypothetical protein
MANRWPGGLIRKTPVTPTTSAAPGIWTLAEAAYWTKQGLWPKPTLPPYSASYLVIAGGGSGGAYDGGGGGAGGEGEDFGGDVSFVRHFSQQL